MASPAKIAKDDFEVLEGFLHCVSPTTVSKRNVKYFNAVLQTDRDKYHKLGCFSPEKQTCFAHACKNGTAVKLSNVKRSISFSDPTGFDVMCNKGTSLEVVQVPFLPRVPPSSLRLTIASVQALGPRQTVGVVEGKILVPGGVSKVVNVKGTECELKEFQIADGTGQLQLSLWDKQIVAVEPLKSYKFTNLSTREREGHIYLSGSPSSTIVEVADIKVGHYSAVGEGEKLSEMVGAITGMQVICKRRCPKCQTPQGEFGGKSSMHRCVGCKLKQKSSSYCPTYSGTVSLTRDGRDETLTISNSSIRLYCSEYNVCNLLNDVEDIEDHFLNIEEVSVFVNEENLITRLKQRLEEEDPIADSDCGLANVVDEWV